jgi:hypothetical protein
MIQHVLAKCELEFSRQFVDRPLVCDESVTIFVRIDR